jgi:hypothetical protein
MGFFTLYGVELQANARLKKGLHIPATTSSGQPIKALKGKDAGSCSYRYLYILLLYVAAPGATAVQAAPRARPRFAIDPSPPPLALLHHQAQSRPYSKPKPPKNPIPRPQD